MATVMSIQEKYMKEALKQAKKALALGEVPIGCVIVHEGKIIGRGYNRRKGQQIYRGLAAGGVRHLHHPGALSHVRRGHHPGPDSRGGHGLHEPKGRLRGLCPEYPGDAPVQPSGRCHQGRAGAGVQRNAEDLFRESAGPE